MGWGLEWWVRGGSTNEKFLSYDHQMSIAGRKESGKEQTYVVEGSVGLMSGGRRRGEGSVEYWNSFE